MKLTVSFDRGNGTETRTIGPGAQVGWELKTKQKISDLGDGVGMADVVIMLAEQLRMEGEVIPTDVRAFANTLIDITPEDSDESAGPSDAGAPPAD